MMKKTKRAGAGRFETQKPNARTRKGGEQVAESQILGAARKSRLADDVYKADVDFGKPRRKGDPMPDAGNTTALPAKSKRAAGGATFVADTTNARRTPSNGHAGDPLADAERENSGVTKTKRTAAGKNDDVDRKGGRSPQTKRRRGATSHDSDGKLAAAPSTNGHAGEQASLNDFADASVATKKPRRGESHDDADRADARRVSTNGRGGVQHDDAVVCVAATPRKKRRGGDAATYANSQPAPTASHNGDDGEYSNDSETENAVVSELQQCKRWFDLAQNVRKAVGNILGSAVAGTLGYRAGLTPEERKKFRPQADALIADILAGEVIAEQHAQLASRVTGIVFRVEAARVGFVDWESEQESIIQKLAQKLPVFSWVKTISGFGPKSLGLLIAETGDLSNYPNPAKVIKRMGLAPFSCKAKPELGARMPSFWAKKSGPSAEEWITIGYQRRRRSLMWNIGKSLLYKKSIYRDMYDVEKAKKQALKSDEWPDWRCHAHGLIIAEKRLLIDLWVQWNQGGRAAKQGVEPSGPVPPATKTKTANRCLNPKPAMPSNGKASGDMKPKESLPSRKTKTAHDALKPKGRVPSNGKAKDGLKSRDALPSRKPKGRRGDRAV